MIELRNVSLRRGKRRIFDKLDLTIADPGLYGLTGPVGSGKSLLSRMLCGQQWPSTGQVIVDEQSQYGLLPRRVGPCWYCDAACLDPSDESIENYARNMVYDSGANQKPVAEFLGRLEAGLDLSRHAALNSLSSGQLCLLQIALSGVMGIRIGCFDGHWDVLDRSSRDTCLEFLGDLRANHDIFLFLTSRGRFADASGLNALLVLSGSPAELSWAHEGADAADAVPLRQAERFRLKLAAHAPGQAVPSGQTYRVASLDGVSMLIERKGEFGAMIAELESNGIIVHSLTQE